jgi:dCMP deaminase
MGAAEYAATKSKDRSTKVGAVIVGPDNETLVTGFNGMPRGVNDDVEERHQRPEKYAWTEHAERNALYTAAKRGISVNGCRIFVPLFPCVDCARGIIQSGIVEVVCVTPKDDSDVNARWAEDHKRSIVLFREAGVGVRFIQRREDA